MNIFATIYSELKKSVGGPAISLKDALNIKKLYPAFPIRFVISQLALNPVFVGNMLMDIM